MSKPAQMTIEQENKDFYSGVAGFVELIHQEDNQVRDERRKAYAASRRIMAATADTSLLGLDQVASLGRKFQDRATNAYADLWNRRREAEASLDEQACARAYEYLEWLENLYTRQMLALSSAATDRLVAFSLPPTHDRINVPRRRHQLELIASVTDLAAAKVGEVCRHCGHHALEISIGPRPVQEHLDRGGFSNHLTPFTQTALQGMTTITESAVDQLCSQHLSPDPLKPKPAAWMRALIWGVLANPD